MKRGFGAAKSAAGLAARVRAAIAAQREPAKPQPMSTDAWLVLIGRTWREMQPVRVTIENAKGETIFEYENTTTA